jgi:ABC-type transporter Mla MlaB component
MDLAAVRRWWPLAATLALLFVTALAATRSAPRLDQISPEETAGPTDPPLPPTQPTATPGGAQPPEAASGLPDWVGTAALVVLGLVGVVVVGVAGYALLRDLVRRRVRRTGRRTQHRREQPRTAEELVAALDAGLEELSDTDRDPRRAVIACWVRLEQAAAAAGTPRHPGDSPTDLVGRLLNEQRVDAQVLAALLDVYRQARYATHTVDDQMRRQARSALERLRADLGAGVHQ